MLKAPKETIIRKVASPKTYYAIAAIWVLGTLVLPMYKLSSYLILIPVAVATSFICKKFVFPDEEVEVEVETPRSYFSKLQQQFIEDGTKSLNNIMELNKKIDNPDLNKDVSDLVQTSDKILDYVYEHEQAASSLRKLIYYYLPTVEKLLTRYDEIEESSVSNVVESRKKIEDIIKTTSTAFSNQLEQLYDTDTLDINSEVKVLEQIYVKEGLINPEDKQ